MEEGASAWSGLGSSMALPSTIREELTQLQIELRDLKLQIAKDTMELKDALGSIAVELSGVLDKHKSLLTRIEGLEVRAQGIGYPSRHKDEFNAFAYVSLEELEASADANEEGTEVMLGTEGDVVQPVGTTDTAESALTDEDVAAIFLQAINDAIDEDGGVMNNNMHHKYPQGYVNSPEVKKLVKKALAADDSVSEHKIDNRRKLFYRTGDDAEALYERMYG